MRPTITLAIPAYNAAVTLGCVLDSVRRQSRAPDELLVVDDGSIDATTSLARGFGITLIRHEQNHGLAAARNTCLRRAKGEILVFLDADALPEPDLVDRLSDGYADPLLAGIGGQLLEPATDRLPDRWRALFWRQTQGERRLERAPFLIGACCSVRRRAVLEVGGFAEGFRQNGEDVELSLRLRRRGWRLIYEPQARALHLRRDDYRSLVAMVYRHSRDHVIALRTHEEPCQRVIFNALRWGPISTLSSLRRHHSPSLALLSPICCGSSLCGCALGLLRSKRDRR
jgi:GT2 family glycosyltransferase